MDCFTAVCAKNKQYHIHRVTSQRFARYGRLRVDPKLASLTEAVRRHTTIPDDRNVYVASDPTLEQDAAFPYLQDSYYGQCPIQFGYCNGHSKTLKAMEYHMGSELLFAATPLILVLGFVGDLEAGRIHTSQFEVFYVDENDVVELYGTTLHHAPCAVRPEGFQSGIVLLRGTNTPLSDGIPKEQFLWQKNKWLLACHDNEMLCSQGVSGNIDGPTIEIND